MCIRDRASVDLGEIGRRQIRQLDAPPLAVPDRLAGDLMRLRERDALPDEPVGDVGRQREAGWRPRRQPLRMEHQRADHPRHRGQQDAELVQSVEDGLLVLLKVAVVGQRQPLEGRQQAGEIADCPLYTSRCV